MTIHRDDFMTAAMGFDVFKVIADDADHSYADAAGDSPHAMFYVKLPTTDAEAMRRYQRDGFGVIDVNITFERRPGEPAPTSADGVTVAVATPDHHAAVLDIAEHSFIYDRFHADPRVPDDKANDLKRGWMANYCRGQRGEEILVGLVDGEVAGFLGVLAGKWDGEDARIIDLVAVSRAFQRRGVGRRMVDVFNGKYGQVCDKLIVGTQVANIPSSRLYEQRGYKLTRSTYVLHAHRVDGEMV